MANSVDVVFSNFKIGTMLEGAFATGVAEHNTQIHATGEYGALYSHSIGVSDGVIEWVLPSVVADDLQLSQQVIDGNGTWLLPGLIDCHTHLVYGGNRFNEWESRLKGKSYEEIAREGGGILSSVRSTRQASFNQLVAQAKPRVERLMQEGVTTIEIKSGYGLDLETELKMLRVAEKIEQLYPITVAKTLLAAHAIPPEFDDANRYVDLVCEEIIPAAKDLCESVDAFCESIAFDIPQTARVLNTAIAHGLQIKVHAEQLTRTGIAAVAAELGAISVDHLEYLSAGDCKILAESGTTATLLPGAFYCLKEKQFPPIRELRDHGVSIAIATDCNPGSSPVLSLLLMANMACNLFTMTAVEALRAITANAARALGRQDQIGILRPGMRADFSIWSVESPAEIVHGIGHNPCVGSFKNGRAVERRFTNRF